MVTPHFGNVCRDSNNMYNYFFKSLDCYPFTKSSGFFSFFFLFYLSLCPIFHLGSGAKANHNTSYSFWIVWPKHNDSCLVLSLCLMERNHILTCLQENSDKAVFWLVWNRRDWLTNCRLFIVCDRERRVFLFICLFVIFRFSVYRYIDRYLR